MAFLSILVVGRHLGCFHVLAIVNSAVMKIEVHVSFCIMTFSGYVPSRGISGSFVVICMNLESVTQSEVTGRHIIY